MGLPVEVNNLMMGSLGGYTVGRSLRFRSSASAFLNRTPASASNRQIWTWSSWVKRGQLGAYNVLFSAANGASIRDYISFDSNDRLTFDIGDATLGQKTTTQVFRDPSAWYHIVVAEDTTQATANNRIKMYVNGVEVTAFTLNTAPSQNYSGGINNNVVHRIANAAQAGNAYLDGYLAEVNFIDGQALTPSSFGAYDTNGVWQPKKYTGTYGTNGFYLPFSLNSNSTYAGSFNGSNQYLSITNNAAFNLSSNNFTVESWINPSALPSSGAISNISSQYDAGLTATNRSFLFALYNNGGTQQLLFQPVSGTTETSIAFNFPFAVGQWYHVAAVRNSNTITLYVNGVSIGSTSYSSTINNSTTVFIIGARLNSGAYQLGFNGSISNFRLVNGSAVYTANFTPSTSALTAITNTQLLTLQGATIVDNSANAFTITNNNSVTTSTATPFGQPTIASDSSGNGNNWTPNNISLTAGTTYDSMIDSPTVSQSASNYAVLNAVNNFSIGLTGGNLDVSTTSAYAYASATFSLPSSGKWYWEFTDTSSASLANQRCAVGFGLQGYRSSTTYIGQLSTDWFYLGTSGNLFNNASGTSYGATYTQNDVIGIAVDCATGKFWFSKNGTFQASGDPVAGTGQAGTLSGTVSNYVPMVGNLANSAGLSCVGSVNFGQRPFSYTPPTGFNALNTYNLP